MLVRGFDINYWCSWKEQVKERNVMNDSRLFSPLFTLTSHHKQKFGLLKRVEIEPILPHRKKNSHSKIQSLSLRYVSTHVIIDLSRLS